MKINTDIFSVSEIYEITNVNYFDDKIISTQMQRNTILFKVSEKGLRDIYFLFYVNPAMKLVVDNEDYYTHDLKPQIERHLGKFDLKDLYCNNLQEVRYGDIYMLP